MSANAEVLSTLLDLAERERDAAMNTLRQAEDGSRKAQAQAEQLVIYRQDSLRRWGAHAGQTASGASLGQVHGFMQRLDQASAQQRHQCAHSDRLVAQARQALLTKELRVAAVRKLMDRRRNAASVVVERRAQKQLDEAATRGAWAARAEASSQF